MWISNGVNLRRAAAKGGFPAVLRSFLQRVAADGGTVQDVDVAKRAYRISSPQESFLWVACAYKMSKDYSLKPIDGTGDFTYAGGGNAVSMRFDGLWQVGWAANTPRSVYTAGVLGHLIEPQRQLLITYPRTFSNAAWIKSNATVEGGYTCTFVNNLGVNTNEGFKLTATDANAKISLATAYTTVTASVYVNSIFIKRITGTGQISIIDVNNTARAITITNEWQRYEYAATAAGTSGQIGIQLATAGDEVMICHAQAELDASSTSPIYGSEGGLVTRNADLSVTPSITGLFNSMAVNGITIYFEFDNFPILPLLSLFSIGNNSSGFGVQGLGFGINAGYYYIDLHDSITRRQKTTSIIPTLGRKKIIIRYNPSGLFDFFCNGVKSTHNPAVTALATVTAANVIRFPGVLNAAGIPSIFSAINYYHILSPLSDAECITRTTL